MHPAHRLLTAAGLAVAATTAGRDGSALSPGMRSGALMVYDAAGSELVLFGGDVYDSSGARATLANDLWAWNGRSWRMLRPVDGVAPPPRATAHLAYDAARHRIILFGGRRSTSNGGIEIMRDLWEWDGVRWHEADDTLSVLHATVVYDPARRRVVTFGGLDGGRDPLRLRRLREWDGAAWRVRTRSELAPAGPTAPVASAVTPAGDLTIIDEQSGRSTDSVATATWTWSAGVWTRGEPGPAITSLQAAASAPDGTIAIYQRSAPWLSAPVMHLRAPSGAWTHAVVRREPTIHGFPALAYDPARGRFVLYGGDLWEWNGTGWERP